MAHDEPHAWHPADGGDTPGPDALEVDKKPTDDEEVKWVEEWELAARQGSSAVRIGAHEKHKMASYLRWRETHNALLEILQETPDFIINSDYLRAYLKCRLLDKTRYTSAPKATV